MTPPAPWRDALRRSSSQASAAAAPRADEAPPRAISPALAALEAERAALTARMAALAGGADETADPRYLAASIAERRAEFARWASVRDRQAAARLERLRSLRTPAASELPEPPHRTARAKVRSEAGASPEPVPWPERRDKSALAEPAAPPLRPTAADREGRYAEPRDSPASAPEARPEHPHDGLLAAPRRAHAAVAAADDALHQARRAIPEDWRRRVEARIPGLGQADTYARRAHELLGVATGSLDALEQRAERLRERARARREGANADAARDEARRTRAMDNRRRRCAGEES